MLTIKKYQRIYNVAFEEAKFFLDLERTQTKGKLGKNFKQGYFTKFKADTMEIFRNNNYYSYVLKDHKIIALDLSRWEINKLPKSIGSLSKLQYLNLENLELRIFPESIKFLSKLKYLNLSGNNINNIPNWLKEFTEKNFLKNMSRKG